MQYNYISSIHINLSLCGIFVVVKMYLSLRDNLDELKAKKYLKKKEIANYSTKTIKCPLYTLPKKIS